MMMKGNVFMDDRLRTAFRLCLILVALLLTMPMPAHAQKKEAVTFNFVDVDLQVVAKFVSEVTGKNFIFDDTFKGQVTIIAPTEMSSSDAFKLFTSVLELKGYTLVRTGVNAYKIMKTGLAKHEGLAVKDSGRTVNESYVVRLITLKHISADEAVNFLKPVISRDGHISSFGPGNLVLIIESGMNIDKVLDIVKIIDKPSTSETPEMIFLEHASADDIANIINEGQQPIPGAPKLPGLMSKSKVMADMRLNAVVIFGPKEDREPLKQLIALLDVPSEESQGRINVYPLENADAEEVAKILQGVIKGVEEKAIGQKRKPPQAAQSTGIIVTPDTSTNSLVIIASPSEFRSLQAIIKKLDRRKKQVYVEAMIVEASINNLLDLGTRWRAMATHNGEPIVVGGVGVMDQTSIMSIITGLAGFSVGGMGNFIDVPVTTINSSGTVTENNLTVPGFAALFSLNEFKGIINVLSTPQILTSDNEEAEIVVGENVPFITKRESSATATTSVFTDVERQDVGIKLRITPQIAEGDYVIIDLYQEISSVKQEGNADILISVGPTTTKRSTKTSVVVKDNQTVVIGGLMQERTEDSVTKVPLLGDIPLLGWLFKFKSKQKEKTNLFVFLTPHVIRDANDLTSLTRNKGLEYARSQNMYVPGELLIRFKKGLETEKIDSILAEHKARIVSYVDEMDVYLISLPPDTDLEDAIDELSKTEGVEFVELNHQFSIGRDKSIFSAGSPPPKKESEKYEGGNEGF